MNCLHLDGSEGHRIMRDKCWMNTVSASLVAFRAVRFHVFVDVSISLAITNIKFKDTVEFLSELSK